MQMAMTPLVAAARRLGMKLELVCPTGPMKHTVSELRGQIPDDPLWSLWGLRDVYRWCAHDDKDGARTLTDRVEGAVGRDLQFIRINGTLVGGLVGLTIHALDVYVI